MVGHYDDGLAREELHGYCRNHMNNRIHMSSWFSVMIFGDTFQQTFPFNYTYFKNKVRFRLFDFNQRPRWPVPLWT